MKCPHCVVEFHDKGQWDAHGLGDDRSASYQAHSIACPKCNNRIIRIHRFVKRIDGGRTFGIAEDPYFAYPRSAARPISPEVPQPYSTDFTEAAAVLQDSPKASAAISRRVLQHVLRDVGGAKKRDLYDQIEELLPTLPGYLQDLHAIRHIGNFGAHPSKNANTGEIVDVEPGEAEWLLDMLESVFDFYFVQPAIRRQKLLDLNKKLKEAGKPELPVK